MLTEKRPMNALIVSRSDKTAESLASILASSAFTGMMRARSAGEARRMILDRNIDVAIINTPLPDDFGIQLAMELSERNLGVLIFVKSEQYDPVAYKLEDYGVITMAKPVDRNSLVLSIRMLKAMRTRLIKLEEQRSSLEDKMREIRLVNRAKWILIERMSMTEEQAHHYIEKEAMDACVKKGKIAENIIKTYEV